MEAVVRVYVRSLDQEYFNKLVERVKNIARGAALMTGAEVDFQLHGPTYEAGVPNLTLVKLFHKNLLELGVEVEEPCDSARRILSGERSYSTDYGNIERVIPGGTIYIPIGPKGEAVLHTAKAVEMTKSEEAHKALIIGTKAMVLTAIDFITRPELAEEPKKELETYKLNGYRHPYPTGKYPSYLSS